MSRNVLETALGAAVLVVALAFVGWAYSRSGDGGDGYELVALFSRADGLSEGSEVRISGIAVGQVLEQSLDPQTYQALVRFTVRDDVELPADTSASVATTGLLGGSYLALQPGADTLMLEPGDRITFTQPAVNISDLIGRFLFSGEGGQGGQAPAPAPQGDPFGDG